MIGHTNSIYDVKINQSENFIVSGSVDKNISFWWVYSGQNFKTIYAHSNSIDSVAISLDEKFILSGSYDKLIKLWSLNWKYTEV